jgi:hypothetical protein
MKMMKQILLSGALVAVAAQAGQKFNVQFPFRTPAGDFAAGRYNIEVRHGAAQSYVEMTNVNSRKTVLLYPTNPVTNMRGTERTRLEFACSDGGCDLKRLWHDRSSGMDFKQRKLTSAEKERLTAVRDQVVTAE